MIFAALNNARDLLNYLLLEEYQQIPHGNSCFQRVAFLWSEASSV